jgi:hypothetical protein
MQNRITAEQYREYVRTGKLPGAPRKSKYRNRRTPYGADVYDSAREANRAAELDMLTRAGEIAGYAKQVPFRLPGDIVYRADFVVLLQDGTYRIEDAKGVRTKEYRLKKRLMKARGLEITEV